MEVYIEYAFFQNFLFDGVLLYLALKVAKTPIQWKRIILSATIGAVFAILFPLLNVGGISFLLKISGAFLICLIPSELKSKKERSRYWITVFLFLIFTFALGGSILGLSNKISQRFPMPIIFTGLFIFAVVIIVVGEKLYQKRAISAFLYPCILRVGNTRVQTEGFFDTGNSAHKNGVPICFLSPDLFYDLLGEEIFDNRGQVFDEIAVCTVHGEKISRAKLGEILIEKGKEKIKKQVYFALSKNSISQEYRLLLNVRLFD